MIQALVLAAGRSTRIAAATGGGPKPLLEIGGKTVLEHNLSWLSASGIRDVTINLHHRPEEIRARIGDGSSLGINVRYVVEEELQGTAGAYRNLATQQRCWVVYGDNLTRFDLERMQARHAQTKPLLTIALFDQSLRPHTGIAGGRVHLNSDDTVADFLEGGTQGLVNAGVYLLEPEVGSFIPARENWDFARDLFPALLKARRTLQGHSIEGYCLGLDTPQSWARARELVDSGEVVL